MVWRATTDFPEDHFPTAHRRPTAEGAARWAAYRAKELEDMRAIAGDPTDEERAALGSLSYGDRCRMLDAIEPFAQDWPGGVEVTIREGVATGPPHVSWRVYPEGASWTTVKA
jgi:hypothetical protein